MKKEKSILPSGNIEILCKKCKTPMRDITHFMIGINKRCELCGIIWHNRMGFNSSFKSE